MDELAAIIGTKTVNDEGKLRQHGGQHRFQICLRDALHRSYDLPFRDLIDGVDGYTPLAFSVSTLEYGVEAQIAPGDLGITPAALAGRYRRRPRLLVIPASLAIVGRAAQVVKVSVRDRGQLLKLWFALRGEFAPQNTTCSWATEAFMSFRRPWPGARYRHTSKLVETMPPATFHTPLPGGHIAS
jgi:hypothetical protein